MRNLYKKRNNVLVSDETTAYVTHFLQKDHKAL